MEKLPHYLSDYIMKFVPRYIPRVEKPIFGLDAEIEKLKRSPKLTSMGLYKMDEYEQEFNKYYYKKRWK